MNRIDSKFAKLKEESRAALVTYIMAYDPDKETSQELLVSLPESGADIIELGIPFSDPMAEGPIIQLSAERALKAGASVKGVLEIVKDFRSSDNETPIILMGYFNPILHYGIKEFVKDAKEAGADGCIIVDLPTEEENEFTDFAYPEDLHLIKLSAPTTDSARAGIIYENAKGFAYYVSITGITGTKTADFSQVEEQMNVIKSECKIPMAVGFGIKNAEHAAQVGGFADGVVVGSSFIKLIEENLNDKSKILSSVKGLVSELSDAVRNTAK